MASVKLVTEKIKNDILLKKAGRSGDVFYSIRELANAEGISYVTAQKVTSELRRKGLVMLCGKHQYITCGPCEKQAPIMEYLSKYKGEKKRIGMYLNKLTNEFFTAITERLNIELNRKGFELVILTGDGSFESEKSALDSFLTLGAEAVISCPGFGVEISEVYRNYILPTVFVGRYPNNYEKSTAVLVNNVNAGRQIASHLLECGCKSFVYVGTPQLKGEKDMRLEGFKKQLSLENVIFNDENLIRLNNENSSEARVKFKEVYSRCEKPVGVFCYHDMLAVKIIGMCNRYGISVPGDILLAGVDDLPLCEYVSPRLTSISYRFDIMADLVVKALFALIENPENSLGHRYVNQSLVIRKSTEKN